MYIHKTNFEYAIGIWRMRADIDVISIKSKKMSRFYFIIIISQISFMVSFIHLYMRWHHDFLFVCCALQFSHQFHNLIECIELWLYSLYSLWTCNFCFSNQIQEISKHPQQHIQANRCKDNEKKLTESSKSIAFDVQPTNDPFANKPNDAEKKNKKKN